VMFDTAALKAMKRVLMNTEGIGDNNGHYSTGTTRNKSRFPLLHLKLPTRTF
jgi:hypothetical protein